MRHGRCVHRQAPGSPGRRRWRCLVLGRSAAGAGGKDDDRDDSGRHGLAQYAPVRRPVTFRAPRANHVGVNGPDQAGFEALLTRHRGIIFKVANTFCRDPRTAGILPEENLYPVVARVPLLRRGAQLLHLDVPDRAERRDLAPASRAPARAARLHTRRRRPGGDSGSGARSRRPHSRAVPGDPISSTTSTGP